MKKVSLGLALNFINLKSGTSKSRNSLRWLGAGALGVEMFMGVASLYAAAFEGKVDYSMTAKQGTETLAYLIQGNLGAMMGTTQGQK